jgi:hypothetical protein
MCEVALCFFAAFFSDNDFFIMMRIKLKDTYLAPPLKAALL